MSQRNVNPTQIRVLSFDPGWETTGCALLETSSQNAKVTVVRFDEWRINSLVRKAERRAEVDAFGARTVAMTLLRQMIDEAIAEYAPDYICSEDAFFSRFPQAHRALVEWLTVLTLSAVRTEQSVYLLAPKAIKLAATGRGDADKIMIQTSIMGSEDIHFRHKKTGNVLLHEHDADAIAVGVAFTKLLLPGLLAKQSDSPTQVVTKSKSGVNNRKKSHERVASRDGDLAGADSSPGAGDAE